jgi:hypothetical protein
MRPEFSSVRLDVAVGDVAKNVSLSCCKDSEGDQSYESLHLELAELNLAGSGLKFETELMIDLRT